MEMQPIVITGIGLTSPIGNEIQTYRNNLLEGKSGIKLIDVRYMGKLPAGSCDFDLRKHQTRKEARRGTRAGSIGIYCAREAFLDANLELPSVDRSRVGVYVGTTEHGNVETENEIALIKEYDYDTEFWSHHHNPRTVSNNPAGEICLNMGITGPHVCLGSACAAGNIGVIHAAQQLMLGDVDIAIGGGVSESIHTFGIFAGFKNQNSLASHPDPQKASRPFDMKRNGIVISEGGCLFILEKLDSALSRGARIYAEIAGYGMNTDATDFVLPNSDRQAQCMRLAINRAGISPGKIDLISTHATATREGDIRECEAIRKVFGSNSKAYVNNTKSFIGHAMGAAGSLEIAGNLLSFEDGLIHPTINLDELDPKCNLPNIVANKTCQTDGIEYILKNSFGMLGINAVLVLKRYNS